MIWFDPIFVITILFDLIYSNSWISIVQSIDFEELENTCKIFFEFIVFLINRIILFNRIFKALLKFEFKNIKIKNWCEESALQRIEQVMTLKQ